MSKAEHPKLSGKNEELHNKYLQAER